MANKYPTRHLCLLLKKSLIKLPPKPNGAKWATPAKEIDKMVYRFNGPGYLKTGYSHVFVLPVEGGTPRQVTSGDYHHGGAPFSRGSGQATWAPDSKSLLVSAIRRDDAEFEPLASEVYQFSIADGSVKTLTNRVGPDNQAMMSPNGKHLAYTGYDDRYQGYQRTELYLANADGSSPRSISSSLDRRVGSIQWAPDSKGIYFLYQDQGDTKLGYCSLSGKIQTLATNLSSRISAYASGQFHAGPNGKFVVTRGTSQNPADLSVGSTRDKQLQQITNVNADLFAQRTLGEVEEIWYESSHDGRKIHGWIIKPPNFDPAKKYPLVLEIHGGPFGELRSTFRFRETIFCVSRLCGSIYQSTRQQQLRRRFR